MKRILILGLLLVASALTSPLFAQQDPFVNDFIERLENSRAYLIKVAELMPEDNYTFTASPDSKTFAENLMHISWALDWHCQSLLGGRDARDWETDNELKVDDKTKAQMIAKINETFGKTISFMTQFDATQLEDKLDYFELKRSKRQIFMLLSDHITHHRAQMLVYLRLNGLVPPRYTLFQ